MAPTRELAQQISVVLVEAGSKCGINCICIYGGVGKKEQVRGINDIYCEEDRSRLL
jgi:ATP-dependent RNA helicase DBP3